MAQPFERDFGYLMPFLDKVEQAAAGLADPRARAELVQLMREERARWARIRALLGGAAGQGGEAGTAIVRDVRPAMGVTGAGPARPGTTPPQAPRPTFTVGPLRRRDEGEGR